jgi:hypothetical protein
MVKQKTHTPKRKKKKVLMGQKKQCTQLIGYNKKKKKYDSCGKKNYFNLKI